jgi:argininosuccinate synthase
MVGTRQSALIPALPEPTQLIGDVPDGGAEAIASRGEVSPADELLDAAAMEFGTD